MSLMKLINFRRIGYTTFGVVFLMSGLLINFLQFFIYYSVKPFSITIFRKLNYLLSFSLHSQILFLLQYWASIRVTLHGLKKEHLHNYGKERAIILTNHRYETDWMLGLLLGDVYGVMGNIQGVVKKSLQFVPTIGFSWKVGGSVFLERNWDKDEKILSNGLRELVVGDDLFWLLLAAEGTRFTQEKYEASRAYAKKQGLPELQYHLSPRTRGFTTVIQVARHKIAAIYNVNLAIDKDGVKPTLTNILLGKSPKVEIYVERIPMKDLPESETELADWLHKTFKRKDELLHSYFQNGHWKAVSDPRSYESYPVSRKTCHAINFSFWAFVVLLPLGYFIMKLLITGNLLNVAVVVGILGSFVYAIDQLAGESKIRQGSSNGTS